MPVSATLSALSAKSVYHFRVVATSLGGTSYGGDEEFETLPAAPSVTGLSPNHGFDAGGISVTITGTGMAEATAVKFGSVNATSFTIESPTSITAVDPSHAPGTVNVTVANAGGTSATSEADRFTYKEPVPPPTITKLKPKSGPTAGGTPVTITGTNFIGVTAVKFGSTAAKGFKVNSAASITAESPPEAAGTVEVSVTTESGTSSPSSKDKFKFKAPKK